MNQKTMKALVLRTAGQQVLEDVPVPQILEPTDVVAKVTLATICSTDPTTVDNAGPQLTPTVEGHEFTCTIVETGSDVKNFKVGDRCLALPAASCGECPTCQLGLLSACAKYGAYGSKQNLWGAFAEYVRIPAADRNLVKIPDSLTEEDAIFAGDVLMTSLFAVNESGVKEGGTIAVFGCGAIGMGAVINAKKMAKAGLVIAIDQVQSKLDLIKEKGYADVTINSAEADPAEVIKQMTQGWGLDAVVDGTGNEAVFNTGISCLHPGGTFMSYSMRFAPATINWMDVCLKNLTVKSGIAKLEHVPEILAAIERGDIDAKFMQTHKMPLNNILEAFDIWRNRNKNGCIKMMITPYEH